MNKPAYTGYYLESVLKSEQRKLFKVISLFAGGGGSSTGYRLAGGHILAINEFVERAVTTYKANYPDTKIYSEDIRETDPAQVLKDLGLGIGDLDILDGSPPCSAFSMAGSRNKAWGVTKKYSNTKLQVVDDLFFEYIRFVDYIQPKIFVAENVAGLNSGKAKIYLADIINKLQNCGYVVKAKILNSVNYGVAQQRNRLIIIGIRKDLYRVEFDDLIYPKHFDYYYNLGDLKDLLAQGSVEPQAWIKNPNYIEYWHGTKPGTDFNLAYRKKTGKPNGLFNLYKLNWLNPSLTILAKDCIYHPSEARKMSVFELQQIMSLPLDYKNIGSFAVRTERCGRMVPPKMMQAIAENLYKNILTKI